MNNDLRIKDLIRDRARQCLYLARLYFYGEDDTLVMPQFKYSLQGGKAGTCLVDSKTKEGTIGVNMHYARHYGNEYINNTIPHELAHYVKGALEIAGPAHGKNWRNILGKILQSSRVSTTHRYCVSKGGGQKKFATFCGCRTHYVTRSILQKIRTGSIYKCRKCKLEIKEGEVIHAMAEEKTVVQEKPKKIFLITKDTLWVVGFYRSYSDADKEAKKYKKQKFDIVASTEDLEAGYNEQQLKQLLAFLRGDRVEDIDGGNYSERVWEAMNYVLEYAPYLKQCEFAKEREEEEQRYQQRKQKEADMAQEKKAAKKAAKKTTKKKTTKKKTSKRIPGKKPGTTKKKSRSGKKVPAKKTAAKKTAAKKPTGDGYKGFRAGTMKEKACKFYFEKSKDRQKFIAHTETLGATTATAASWYNIFKNL